MAAEATPCAGQARGPVLGNDLNFSAAFTVLAGAPALPANNPARSRRLDRLAAAGAHARAACSPTAAIARGGDASLRPHLRGAALIFSKDFEMPVAQARPLSHKIADEVSCSTRASSASPTRRRLYRRGGGVRKYLMDYDGVGSSG